MNCQDIFRLVDTGSFAGLSETQRQDADAHARTCPHCAPVWGAHTRLAQQRIPAMPVEFAARVRTLAALPRPATGARTWRRLTVVGCVVALAAAASLLVVHQSDTEVAEPEPVVTLVTAEPNPTMTLSTAEEPTPEVAGATVMTESPVSAVTPNTLPPLPLLPAPVYESDVQRNARIDQALQKAAEQHPELVEGPDLDDMSFAVGVAMREDGVLLSTAVKLAPRGNPGEAMSEVERTLPKDGGGMSHTSRAQHYLLLDGRTLRASTSLVVSIMPLNYDVTRSNVRVLQILGDQYADQLMPASSPDLKRLTVFLSEDGSITHAKVDNYFSPTESHKMLIGGDPNDAIFLAQKIADRLGIDITEMGVVGATSLERGSTALIPDGNGGWKPDPSLRRLPVYYAWARRASDAGPTFMQSGSTSNRSTLDVSAALRIVERMIPDAFTVKDTAAGEPTVVLTANGEVIAAGRVKHDPNVSKPEDTVLQEQLVPGVRTNSFSNVRVKNNLGEVADVSFAWEMPEEMQAAMKKAEAEWAAAQAVKAGAQ